ncbi:aminoglycoside phosphotransferase family protein [Prochlorococcus sp. MIT 0601]|uniref:phosphotransferase enzyme family protein n=1 Tax=Prochlorococcus sp. MIT 0601 TaxID=1499498 RepID=UPI00053395C3|nr:aminoglycoside phosphotransferase family protein [Prochlorococcus sp. MIT 0601]KGG12590.1 Homoserine/choline kinase family protein [Prochlorococcus sp. MIT 0601]
MIDNIYFSHDQLQEIASYFCEHNVIFNIKKLKSGNINNTYLVSPTPKDNNSSFILQLINPLVFQKPEMIIDNYLLFLDIIDNHIDSSSNPTSSDFLLFPELLPNLDNGKYFLKYKTNIWRGIHYIQNTLTIESITSTRQAENLGNSLNVFHRLTREFPLDRLFRVIENFHNIDYYLYEYDQMHNSSQLKFILQSNLFVRVSKIAAFIIENRTKYTSLVELGKKENLSYGLIHGDTKITNYLFNKSDESVKSIIDLDTIQEGYLILDLADCLRSICNKVGEDTLNIELVDFDLDIFESFLRGYIASPGQRLNSADLIHIPYFVSYICFELCLRFFTDFLKGSNYFKADFSTQNLLRAEVQIKLLKLLEMKNDSLMKIINGFKNLFQ